MPPTYQLGGFQPPPKFTKQLMIGIFVLAVLELILEQWIGMPLSTLLIWRPFDAGFQPWQVLGNYLFFAESPIQIALNILMIYFFVPPIQRTFGRKGFLRLCASTIAISSIFALFMDLIGAINNGQAFGLGPLITAMFVVFGLSNPKARILLFFILPIQAVWISYGSAIMAFLYFISSRDLASALWLGGCISGFAFMNLDKLQAYRTTHIRNKHRATQQRVRSQFKVYKGGKDDNTPH